ncbi:TRM1 [Candida theae]|uniref:tRNA (guanine(26)-N(2))-dimethyltransferase n=1 Tax=Candida theae TaxID=1198502 RepID=A0AAD5FXK6_9ASCO|nr:TRM1 [Candida theae]KAI5954841.1 TRM1 [Candida theae]
MSTSNTEAVKSAQPVPAQPIPTSADTSSFNYTTEGKATILTPKKDKVFYNPIQQFNRDISTLSIIAYDHIRAEQNELKNKNKNKKRKLLGLTILEALSASGLRSCRYGLEIPNVYKIVANDLSPDAVTSINRNIEHNQLTGKVVANQGDAIKYMASAPSKFNVVDLDPYGTASPFIDAAIQCVEEDGMLLVTCTDAAVLAGSGYPEKCFALYGGNNFGNSYINSETNHEVGIRLMLQSIAATAARYKKSIEPMLSLSIDYYFRVWVKVKTSPIKVKNLASETMLTYGCNGCGQKVVQPLGIRNDNKYVYPKLVGQAKSHCEFCGSTYNVAGPMYAGPLHNQEFIKTLLTVLAKSENKVYKTSERIKGMLTLAQSELDTVPFFYNLNHLSSIFKSPPISIDEYSKAVGNMGYKLSLTHAKKNCIKSDIPWEKNLEIIREWTIKQNKLYIEEMKTKLESEGSLNEKITEKLAKLDEDITYSPNLNEKSVGAQILKYFKQKRAGTYEVVVDFDTSNAESEKISKLRKVKMVRYQENPTKNWGPMARPK